MRKYLLAALGGGLPKRAAAAAASSVVLAGLELLVTLRTERELHRVPTLLARASNIGWRPVVDFEPPELCKASLAVGVRTVEALAVVGLHDRLIRSPGGCRIHPDTKARRRPDAQLNSSEKVAVALTDRVGDLALCRFTGRLQGSLTRFGRSRFYRYPRSLLLLHFLRDPHGTSQHLRPLFCCR